jgi:hypothetical protein
MFGFLSECGGHAAALYSPALPAAQAGSVVWAAGRAGEQKRWHGRRTPKENRIFSNTVTARCLSGISHQLAVPLRVMECPPALGVFLCPLPRQGNISE